MMTTEAISAAPPADLCHALRWYNHIKSYQSQKSSLPGVKKPLGQYGPAGVADSTSGSAPAKEEDDDDIDLFGSDEEEGTEARPHRQILDPIGRQAVGRRDGHVQAGGVCSQYSDGRAGLGTV